MVAGALTPLEEVQDAPETDSDVPRIVFLPSTQEKFHGDACEALETPLKAKSEKRLFVAGPSIIRERCQEIIDAAKAEGWTITYDWTRSESWLKPVPDLLTLAEESERNLHGVRAAQVVLWVCSDEASSTGAGYEAGYAKGLGIPVVAYWDCRDDGTCAIHCFQSTATHFRLEDALVELKEISSSLLLLSWS